MTPRRRTVLTAVAVTLVIGTGGTGVAVAAAQWWMHPSQAVAAGGLSPGASDAAPSAPPKVQPAPVQATPPAPTAPAVAPLGQLAEPDLLVVSDQPLAASQVAALQQQTAAEAVNVTAAGVVPVAGAPTLTLGVDPSSFRRFTPAPTASSDPLWQAVARGDLVTSFVVQQAQQIPLGGDVPAGVTPQPVRVGGIASVTDHGPVGAVIDVNRASTLGLVPDSAVLISSPGRSTVSLQHAVDQLLPGAHVIVLRPQSPAGSPDYKGKPRTYKELYQAAALTCPGLSWTILAAIGQVESDHGRNAGVSSAGAMGPMQFLPATFAQYGIDGDRDGRVDINDPYDAVYSAARMLCANGAGRGGQSLWNAIFAYNHADWYVERVLAIARLYGGS